MSTNYFSIYKIFVYQMFCVEKLFFIKKLQKKCSKNCKKLKKKLLISKSFFVSKKFLVSKYFFKLKKKNFFYRNVFSLRYFGSKVFSSNKL